MSEPIRIRYRWDRENVEKLFETSYRYLFEHSARRYIGWFFIALLQFGIVAMYKKGAPGLMLFASLALLYWYIGRKGLARRRALRSWEDSPFRDREITILADEEGLEIDSQSGGARWSWDEIDGVVPLGEDLLLLHHPHLHYIPASGFESVEARSAFKSLAREHGRLRG